MLVQQLIIMLIMLKAKDFNLSYSFKMVEKYKNKVI